MTRDVLPSDQMNNWVKNQQLSTKVKISNALACHLGVEMTIIAPSSM
jgi:hypothetical protein